MSAAAPTPNVYDDLSSYLPPSDHYTILSVIQSELNADAADLVDSMEVTFMVNARVGTFTVETPLVFENVPDPQAQAYLIDEYVKQAAGVVDALYAL